VLSLSSDTGGGRAQVDRTQRTDNHMTPNPAALTIGGAEVDILGPTATAPPGWAIGVPGLQPPTTAWNNCKTNHFAPLCA
jgi:hypothetical protein